MGGNTEWTFAATSFPLLPIEISVSTVSFGMTQMNLSERSRRCLSHSELVVPGQ